jgi:ribokinase
MSAPTFDVIVCGSLHLDVMVKTSSLPRLDETVVGTAWSMKCGGKGGNQAIMAAKMGAKTAMIGRVGDDDFGRRLTANLAAFDVECSAIGIDSLNGSGMSVAMLEPNGEYGAVIVSGANLNLRSDECAKQWTQMAGASVLVLQNEVPEPVNIGMAKVAKDSGATVILNAAPARAMGQELLDLVDILVVNRIEAEMLTELPVGDVASAVIAMLDLCKRSKNVVLTLGAGGVVVQAENESPKIIDPIPVKLVSSHGAGDCFIGALARRIADGDGLESASHFANRVAARFVAMNEMQQAGFRARSD